LTSQPPGSGGFFAPVWSAFPLVLVEMLSTREGMTVTTKNKIEEAIANAEMLAGQLKSCALDTDVPAVREMYNRMSQQVEEMIPKLRGRLGHVVSEEPQYRT